MTFRKYEAYRISKLEIEILLEFKYKFKYNNLY